MGNFTVTNANTSTPSITFGGGTLQNYVATTWTPSLQFGGAAVGMTYTTQVGNYIRIGNVIYFDLQIVLSAKGSSTGSATVAGFPFTQSSQGATPINILISNITYASSPVFAVIAASASTITINRTVSASTAIALTATQFTDTSAFYAAGFVIT